jgi:hypothetical protein
MKDGLGKMSEELVLAYFAFSWKDNKSSNIIKKREKEVKEEKRTMKVRKKGIKEEEEIEIMGREVGGKDGKIEHPG